MEKYFKKSSYVLTAITIIMMALVSTTHAHAISQVAGSGDIAIRPGETKPFRWGLISNETTTVEISVRGDGAKFISFPKSVVLSPEGVTDIEGRVTIPQDFPGSQKLNATLVASEVEPPDANPSSPANASGLSGVISLKVMPTKNLNILIQ